MAGTTTDLTQMLKDYFADQFENARKKADIDQKNLAKMLGVKYNTVNGWKNARDLPPAHRLVRLSEILKVSIDQLLGTNQSALPTPLTSNMFAVHKNGKDYTKAVEEVTASTRDELWIQVRGGGIYTGFSGKDQTLEDAIKSNKFAVRLLIGDPEHSKTTWMIAARRVGAEKTNKGIKKEAKKTQSDIKNVISDITRYTKEAGIADKLEIMHVPYISPYLTHISDPNSKNARLVALLPSFGDTKIQKAPMIVIEKQEAPDVFEFFVKDFNTMWTFGENMRNDSKQEVTPEKDIPEK